MRTAARIFFFAASLLCMSGLAREANAAGAGSRKVIDFEGDVVEGISRQPLGSFNQITEEERRRGRAHLYRKRITFKREDMALIRELRMR